MYHTGQQTQSTIPMPIRRLLDSSFTVFVTSKRQRFHWQRSVNSQHTRRYSMHVLVFIWTTSRISGTIVEIWNFFANFKRSSHWIGSNETEKKIINNALIQTYQRPKPTERPFYFSVFSVCSISLHLLKDTIILMCVASYEFCEKSTYYIIFDMIRLMPMLFSVSLSFSVLNFSSFRFR